MSESQHLFNRYINNHCSAEEVEALMMYFHTDKQEELNQLVLQELENFENELNDDKYETLLNDVYSDIQTKILRDKKILRPLWPRIVAAASILLILSFGGYFLLHNRSVQPIAQQQDIKPGINKATLTLANGQKIILTNGLTGKLAQQGTTTVQMSSNNAITYVSSAVANSANSSIAYNTLSTTKGQQSPYPLVLADGTKVWLNAASSVTFPTAFGDKDRLVKITGEAYFEVAHNAAHPFKIAVKGQLIQDIGTHFNVNAYDNEPAIKTTLIEGSVRVVKGTKAAVIKPGQQAITHIGNNLIVVETADLEEAMAWKNGLFLFKKAGMQTVMRQLERWYNVEVVYEGRVPQREFNGDIHRNLNASQVLDVLSYYKVHFRIDDKKIIVKE